MIVRPYRPARPHPQHRSPKKHFALNTTDFSNSCAWNRRKLVEHFDDSKVVCFPFQIVYQWLVLCVHHKSHYQTYWWISITVWLRMWEVFIDGSFCSIWSMQYVEEVSARDCRSVQRCIAVVCQLDSEQSGCVPHICHLYATTMCPLLSLVLNIVSSSCGALQLLLVRSPFAQCFVVVVYRNIVSYRTLRFLPLPILRTLAKILLWTGKKVALCPHICS